MVLCIKIAVVIYSVHVYMILVSGHELLYMVYVFSLLSVHVFVCMCVYVFV